MDDGPKSQGAWSRHRGLIWVMVLAFIIRLGYLADHAESPFFGVPLLDGKYYDALARALAEGRDTSAINPGFRPWLYPLLLAGCYGLVGSWAPFVLIAMQHALGIVTVGLVGLIAARLHGRAAAGWIAGGLYALAGPPLFFEGEILVTTTFTALMTALLAVLVHGSVVDDDAWGLQPRWAWPLAGGLLAVAAQARPNALVFLLAFPVAAWLFREHLDRPVHRAASAVGSTLAVLAVIATLQVPLVGAWQWLPASGGVNLHLGNGVGADGMVPRQGRWVTYGDEYRDSVQVYAAAVYREETGQDGDGRAVSRFWTRKTVEDIAADPGRWLNLMGRKVLFLVWNHEIPNNKSFAFMAENESWWLRHLPVRWGLLLALAALGAFEVLRRDRAKHGRPGDTRRLALVWLLAWVTLASLAVLLFFVAGRYRIPLWPTLAALAAGGVLGPWDALRQRRWPRLAGQAFTLGVILALSWTNLTGVDPELPGRDFFFRSVAHLERNDLEAAEADARRAAELSANDAAAHFQLGHVALARGNDGLAFESFRRASELAPDEPRIYNNVAVLNERRGHFASAYRGYLWALTLADDYGPALVNAALLELRGGRLDRAAQRLERAAATGFESPTLDCARAILAAQRGDAATAQALFDAVAGVDPSLVDRLVAEQQKPLPPGTLDLGP